MPRDNPQNVVKTFDNYKPYFYRDRTVVAGFLRHRDTISIYATKKKQQGEDYTAHNNLERKTRRFLC